MKELDRLLANLKRHCVRNCGLTYDEVVLLDDILSALERIEPVQAAEARDRMAELPFDWFGHSGRPSPRYRAELSVGRA